MAKNQWMSEDGEIIVSESNPNRGLDFEKYGPVVNEHRVRGATYTSYVGNSEWVQAANRCLRNMARRNFEVQR